MSQSAGEIQVNDAARAGPSSGKERFEILEALGGFTLFGIFLAELKGSE